MRLPPLLALAATLFCCATEERAETTRPASPTSAGDGLAVSARLASRDAGTVDEADVSSEPAAPRTDYEAIAEEACQMSGGSCIAKSECGIGVGVELPNVCRPGMPGMTCCRRPATDCPGYETASCCRTVQGRLTNSGASCDRGYPTCLGFSHEYHLAADRQCKLPIEEASPDAPSRWPGTIGAYAAGQWACAQAGGKMLTPREPCDGYLVALATDRCCLPRSLCPEQRPGTDCCQRNGTLFPKECMSGSAICPPGLLRLGTMREVPAGTCQPS